MVRKTLVIAVAAVVASLSALPSFSHQRVLERFGWRLGEFGFNDVSGGPTIVVKAGETVRVVLTNQGGADHEFMIVKDKDNFLRLLKERAAELHARGVEFEEAEVELEDLHEEYTAAMLMMDGEMHHDVVVEPGELMTFTFKINEPGTYYYVCAELVLTYPESHANRGMLGTIEVRG